jgi:hypothetical protein
MKDLLAAASQPGASIGPPPPASASPLSLLTL